MSALGDAKVYLSGIQTDGYRYDHPISILARLVAQIEAAPSVHVDGVVRYADGSVTVCTTPKLTDATLRPLLGKTVRLVGVE